MFVILPSIGRDSARFRLGTSRTAFCAHWQAKRVAAVPWPGPRRSVEELAEQHGRAAVVAACMDLLRGTEVDAQIVFGLGGPPAIAGTTRRHGAAPMVCCLLDGRGPGYGRNALSGLCLDRACAGNLGRGGLDRIGARPGGPCGPDR